VPTTQLISALTGRKVLLVDDEPDSLDVAATLLKMSEAEVITAVNGADGLAKAKEHHPLFIISDLSMPVMDGWELLKALQSDKLVSDIPVIALTAHAMPGDRRKALHAGFSNYLTKPLQPETFVGNLIRLVMDTPQIAMRISPS
jgi:CheY-like chemotaxis protein